MPDKKDNQFVEKYLAEKYGLEAIHFWEHQQSRKWVITHVGCMIIAEKEGIEFSKPEYIKTEPDLIVMYGTATMSDNEGNEKTVWTHGEASHKICFIAYPYAMAEKRLKDRLVLMLVSVYGEVYSEIEAAEFDARAKVQVNKED